MTISMPQLVSEFLQAPPRPPHSFDMGQLLEEMQQIDQQSYRQAPQRGEPCLRLYPSPYQHQQQPPAALTLGTQAPHTLTRLLLCWLCLAPGVAALALSGDWAAEFLSSPESTSTPGQVGPEDAAESDWTREFIADVTGVPHRV